MPVYAFVCEACGIEFERLTIRVEWDNIKCPQCGKKPKKLVTSASFVVKGANAKNLYGLKNKNTNEDKNNEI